MPFDLIRLIIVMLVLMMAMRCLFAEVDARNAIKRMDLAFFLSFTEKFKYRRMRSTLFLMVTCFLLFGNVNITTTAGIITFIIFLVVGMISDFFSSIAYHYYIRYRFKDKMNEAGSYLATLQLKINEPIQEDDAYVYGQDYQFSDVLKEYVLPQDHFVCMSADGGELVDGMDMYPQVSFVIDRYDVEARARLEDKPVRITTLTSDHRYPFKDERMDVVVCYNENYNPEEGKRILKEGGTLLINQLGSDNLPELYAFLGPRWIRNHWNLEALRQGLIGKGYTILSAHEERAELRFRTIASFHHYLKDMALFSLDDLRLYINQFFMIEHAIEKRGFFAVKTHRFYVAARKDNVNL